MLMFQVWIKYPSLTKLILYHVRIQYFFPRFIVSSMLSGILGIASEQRRILVFERKHGEGPKSTGFTVAQGRLHGSVSWSPCRRCRPKLYSVRSGTFSSWNILFYFYTGLRDFPEILVGRVGWLVGWPLRITRSHASGKKNQPKK